MNILKLISFFACCWLPFGHSAPVPPSTQKSDSIDDILPDLHYKEYLKQVQKELENDPGFLEHMKKIQNSSDVPLALEMVHHSVRTKLDEIKRIEVDRLNRLEKAVKEMKEKGPEGVDLRFLDEITLNRDHMDHHNPHTFEMKDLEKLINKVHEDLRLVDKKQDEEYKQYEMEKEHERQKKLKQAKDDAEKEKLKKEYEEAKKRHAEHPQVHHPGSEDQLKEVWEDQDKLDPRDYDPKSFFKMHDLNGDGWWDQNEIEAIMQSELNKVYEENNTDDDINERYHELNRMRNELIREVDKDQDGVITWDEFHGWTTSADYKRDEGWKTEEEQDQPPFSPEEFEEFEKLHPLEDPNQPHDLKAPPPSSDHRANNNDHPAAKGPPSAADSPPLKVEIADAKKANHPPTL